MTGGNPWRPADVRPGVRPLLVLAALATLLAGCSDDTNVDAGSVPTTTAPAPTTTTAPAPALGETLTEDWGCGYGFAAGNPDQTVGLVIQLQPRMQVDQGRLPAQTDLGDGPWDAVVRQGEHLFANWCDDVIDTSEPQPEVTAELPVVEGTMEVTTGRLHQECPSVVVAQLTGVVAEGEDGQRVELGDLDVRNDSWGCFAG